MLRAEKMTGQMKMRMAETDEKSPIVGVTRSNISSGCAADQGGRYLQHCKLICNCCSGSSLQRAVEVAYMHR